MKIPWILVQKRKHSVSDLIERESLELFSAQVLVATEKIRPALEADFVIFGLNLVRYA